MVQGQRHRLAAILGIGEQWHSTDRYPWCWEQWYRAGRYPWGWGTTTQVGRYPWYRGAKARGWLLSVALGNKGAGLVAVHGVGEQRRGGYSLSLIKGRTRSVTPHFSAISRHFAIFSSPMISTTENQVKIPWDAHFLAKSCRPSKADLP